MKSVILTAMRRVTHFQESALVRLFATFTARHPYHRKVQSVTATTIRWNRLLACGGSRIAGLVHDRRLLAGTAAHPSSTAGIRPRPAGAAGKRGRSPLQSLYPAPGSKRSAPRRSRRRAACHGRQAHGSATVGIDFPARLELRRDPRHGTGCTFVDRSRWHIQSGRIDRHVRAATETALDRPAAPDRRPVHAGTGQGGSA